MGCGGSTPQGENEKKAPLECSIDKDDLLAKGWHKEIIEPGTGTPVGKGKRIEIDFKGYLADAPFTQFGDGKDKVIDEAGKGLVKGMNKGIPEMMLGETAIISCAPSHGYADKQNVPGIPPNSILLFKVTMKKVGS
eukprot:TRINITY_DN24756_c0_g1_i1.p1 TRINITY_DN24756_c0_g1~~TRINITY_DN24756_c0_g1_i1.p1  ORF type:complete len:136 (+),score=22.86 TRINITY_DN24756_c0_g1_i1:31-438(+)